MADARWAPVQLMEFYILVPSESEKETGSLFGPFLSRALAEEAKAELELPPFARVFKAAPSQRRPFPLCPTCGRAYDPQRMGRTL